MKALVSFTTLPLLLAYGPVLLAEEAERAPLKHAIERGLLRLEQGSGNYVKNRQCFSCHHQSLTMAAFRLARQKGFTVSEERWKEQTAFTRNSFTNKLDRIRKGEGVGGTSATVSYALFTLEQCEQPADELTRALLAYLVKRQREDGSWTAQTDRPPSEGSRFTNAALSLRAIQFYAEKAQPEQVGLLKRVAEKGKEWLIQNDPVTTEDRAFHLLGLGIVGNQEERVLQAIHALRQEQRRDGGWAQLPTRDSDAYATGQVLVALRKAGVPGEDDAIRRGIAYLRKTQCEDGAWIVETRSRPIQIFFDNGDPGGKSQFISFAATGWAVWALLENW